MKSIFSLLASAIRTGAIAFCAATMVISPASLMAALPSGLQVSHGQLDLSHSAGTLHIDQLTPQAIANWQSFNIGEGNTVNINQLDAQSVLLNRVLGADPSKLMGQLNANGRVFLVNPNGIVVGRNASVNTAEFIASALDISDEDFLNGGDLLFSGDSTQSVVNLGTITADNGDVILIAYKVANEGEINAPEGVAALAAGNEVLLMPEGDQRILVKLGLETTGGEVGAENSGLISAAQAELKAAGGNIYELAINQTGIVHATGTAVKDGRILLISDQGTVGVSGTLTSENVDGSGGEIMIGGDYRGENPAFANAANTIVTQSAVIDVSASTADADAGRAIVWADQNTRFLGTILGQGGSARGDGAFVEVSGKQFLDFNGRADLRAINGTSGQLLLDPASLTIQATGTDSNGASSGTDPFTFGQSDVSAPSILLVTTLENQLGLSSVILDTSVVQDFYAADGSIILNDPVSWTSGNTLTFSSGNAITVNASLDAGAGDIVFGLGYVAQNIFGMGGNTSASLTLDSGATVTADTVTIQSNTNAQVFGANDTEGPFGVVQIDGALDVNILDILYQSSGFGPMSVVAPISIENVNNKIGTLTRSSGTGTLTEDITIFDSEGGLNIGGDFSTEGGVIQIVTTGDLSLNAGASINTTGTDIYLAAQGGDFINNAGAAGVVAGGAGRFLVYSDNPTDTDKGGLVGDPVYNKTFPTNAPGAISQTGNRFLYTLAPVLTFTANDASRVYGDANPSFTFETSGLVGGDSAGDVFTGAPTVSSTADNLTGAGFYENAINVALGSIVLSDFDYQFSGVAGNLTINKATLTVTPNLATREYGDVEPAFSGSFTGFKNSQNSGVIDTLPTFATNALITSGVGDYDITGTGGLDTNYDFSFVAGTNRLSITPAPLFVTGNNASRVYGAGNPSFSASLSGQKNGDTISAFPNIVFSTPDSDVNSGVLGGPYAIRPSGATNPNYTYTYVDGALSITPAALTIQANNAAHGFNNDVPDVSTYSASFNTLVADDQVSDYAGQLVFANTTDGSSTGVFDINVSGVVDPNYTITFLPGTLTIGNQILNVTASDFTRLYGQANPTFTSEPITGFIGGDDASVLLTPITFTTVATANSGIGNYDIVPGGATATNYDFNFVNGTLTINPALLTIKANDASRLYGAANPSFSAAFTGLVAGDLETDFAGLNFATNALVDSDVGGTYSITPSNVSDPNYTISFESGILAITPAPLTIEAQDATRVYGAADPAFDADFNGLVAGDLKSDFTGLAFATDALVGSDVGGAYSITPSGVSSGNYIISFVGAALSITPADLLIAANDFARLYGDANPTFTARFDTLVAGDTENDISNLSFSTAATNTSDVSTYSIVPTGATNSNYNISFANGTLTVNPRLLTIAAQDQTKVFGDASPTPVLDFDNLASFDTESDILNLTVSTVPGTLTGVGDYAITVSGGINPNYTITRENGNLEITQRPVTVAAVTASREYGESNPGFTFTASNEAFGAPLNTGAISFNTLATNTSDVGLYSVLPTGLEASNPNYSFSYAQANLSITAAPLSYSANDTSREYGLANPTFTFADATGYKLSDNVNTVLSNVTLSTVATQGSTVGDYAIDLSAAVINTNYDVTLNDATFTITQAPLFVAPALSSRIYGEANPTTYELTATGLRNGDDESVVTGEFFQNLTPLNTNVGSNGTVSIVAGSAINYNLTFNPGVMNILARPLTITADSFTREYGDANPTFTADFDNLASFDTPSVIPNLSLTTPATPGSNVLDGGYGINVSSNPNPNYAITYVPGILDITPAPLLVELGNVARFYGDANPSPTADVAVGFKNGETISDLSLQVVTTATPTTEVGNFGYNATTFNPNYTLNITGGLLTIEPAPLTLTMRSVSRLYGETNPEPELISIGGLKFPATNEEIVSVSNPTTPGTDAGRYDFAASVLNPNYRLDGFVGDIFISPRPLSIVISGNRAFGDPDPAPSAFSITGNFVNGDQGTDEIDFRYTTPFLVDQDIGSYDITAETTILSNTGNYLPSLTSNTLQITPRFIDVSVSDLARLYGDANPILTLDSTTNIPLFESVEDVVRLSTPADPFSVAGAYAIDAELINANYQFNFLENGVLTVSPREIVILIDNKTRDYGDLNPAFTARYTRDGFASFDDPNAFVSFSSVANQETDVGSYGITADLSNLDPTRYAIDTVVNGNLRIDPRPIGIDFGNLDRIYGDAYTDADITVTSGSIPIFLTPQEFVADLGGLPAPDADVGSYALSEFVFSPNYDVSADSVRDFLIITPRTLTVTVDSFARFFGDANPTFTATFGGDGLSDFLQSQATLTPQTRQATNAVSNAGFYLINLSDSALNDPNFNFIEINPGVLSVLPRPYTIDIADDALALDFGTSFDGLGNFDESAVRFRAAINNVPAFVNLNELAGGLTFEINEVNVPFPMEQVIPPEEFVAPDVSIFEDRGNFVSVSDAGVPTLRPFIASRDGASTSSLTEVVEVIPIEIGGSGAVVVTGEFEPIDPELGTLPLNVTTPDSITRSFFINLATSTSSNQNLTLAGVTPGVLTLRARTNIEQISYELNRAVEADRVSRESLVIRAPSDYQANIGLILADFPDMTFDMLNTYFQTLLSGEGPFYFETDSLFFSIFGKTSGNLADLDPAAIRSWMSDIATNPEKRSQMGSVLIDYLQQMQAIDWKDRTPAQKILVDSVAAKVQEKQQAFVNRLLEKEEQFEATPNASRAYYNARDTADVFEKRAAVAAKDFLHYERDNLTQGEIAVLEAIQYSIVDGDRMSSLALLEQWFEVRGDRKGDALIDGQFEGFIRELTDTKVGMDRARAAIESGVDHGGPEGESAMTTNMAGGHDFLNIELPYGDLLKESSYAGLEAKMARYDSYGDTSVLASLGASTVAGVATGAGIVSAAGSVQTVGRVVFPYVKKAAAVGGKGVSAVGGAVAIVAATTYVFVEGMTALIQHEEQKEIYTSIVDQLSGNVNITDIDFAPETTDVFADDPKPSDIVNHLKKSLLVDALDEMILGI